MRSSDLSLRGRIAAALIERTPPKVALAASQAMGMATRLPLPPGVCRAAVSAYSRYFSVDLADVDQDQLARGFPSFDAFFTRGLRDGARSVDKRPEVLVSPSDGRLREVAEVEAQGVVVAKGHAYAIGELIGDSELASRFVGGLQAVIYLHPRDYHRVHAPISGVASRIILIPGRLLPVNDAAVAREPRLFAVNERQVHVMSTDHGTVAVVMVAAFGVGHMSCGYRQVDAHPAQTQSLELDPPPFLAKGDELGVFHLGSTVVLLTEPGFELVEGLGPDSRVEFGQALLRRKEAS
ncbi:archaetidylserine decarboxylase [Enhygromyxa salina]|uniref:phosphatidylserine decarboxylase n=1 Tax=Enhygromyxa salina TaxID=215803 RepID=A0A2S9YRS8_9BACT|nr:archaetidylserine decarboxylase [Enhygromyxa salina]PRQ07769.1 Phosphatidylserine decarboxylase proenzyme [Enhygromyxa salina]